MSTVQLTPEEREMEERDSLEFHAPGGFIAKVRGAAWGSKEVIIIIVMITCTSFLYLERIQSNKGFLEQHTVTQAQNLVTQSMLGSVIKAQSSLSKEVSDSAEIQAYVLSLPQVQREKLNLSMPPALRARIRQGSQ